MKKTTSSNKPVTFGTRKGGKAAKSRGPKCKKVSKYRGQGR